MSQIDLQPFCATEDSKHLLARPYAQGGYRCACNGRLAVRIPTTDADDAPTETWTPPKLPEVFAAVTHSPPHPWPESTPIVIRPRYCTTCNGRGKNRGPACDTCKGKGFETCNLNHEHECLWCTGAGYFYSGVCPTCKGTGDQLAREIDGAVIDLHYERLISALPGVLVAGIYHSISKTVTGNPGIYFTFDGGEGVVLGISMESKQ